MSNTTPNTCGCCVGLDAETPLRIDNPPGLDAVSYRVGVHARFKESLLAKLSSAGLPVLFGLTTREDNDFTIALCDAVASTLDVLSFYQERIANENFLRTATDQRSILELARLIGYELAPGVAASTWLAFNLQEVPGMRALAAEPVTIPVGVKVQSVPGQDEQPQTFETVESIDARVEWNAIPVQTTLPWRPNIGDKSLWLAGVATGLQAGDIILIVGQDRIDNPDSERWDIRLVTKVTEDKIRQRTRIDWDTGLGSTAGLGAAVYVFRQRLALFGHNAPDPRLMGETGGTQLTSHLTHNLEKKGRVWKNFKIGSPEIDLDNAYAKVLPGSWFALVSNEKSSDPSGLAGDVELYRAKSVSFPSRLDFGLSGKITRIEPYSDKIDLTKKLDKFKIRRTMVLAQPELLTVTETPLGYPLYGETLSLSKSIPHIALGRVLAVSGKRARIRLRRGKPDVTLSLIEGGRVLVSEGDSLYLAAPPFEWDSPFSARALSPEELARHNNQASAIHLGLTLLNRDNKLGVMGVKLSDIELVPAQDDDEEVQEIVFINDLARDPQETPDRGYSVFTLTTPLKHCYDRETVRVNANVARATHGETVIEVLGSGDARVANARFSLRQSPLTYVSAATPSGRRAAFELRANDMLWTATPSLYARGSDERVYEIRHSDGGTSSVRFGDGIEGSRLPSGDHNIRAIYRKGLGLGGNVAAGKITTLLSRPLGVSGAINPEAANGGEDAEREARARENAPLTVLTLERAVSIRDYQDFARAFAGIAKAHALWIPSGPGRGVFITVAGENGAAILETSDTYRFLQEALHRYGDPLMPVRIDSYREARFILRLAVQVETDADVALVLGAVKRRLLTSLGFDMRRFGQCVSVDEVAALAHTVAGVQAVQVVELHRSDAPVPVFEPRLFAALPEATLTGPPLAAEMLVLDPAALTLEVMS